jgi:hypothetical protein
MTGINMFFSLFVLVNYLLATGLRRGGKAAESVKKDD